MELLEGSLDLRVHDAELLALDDEGADAGHRLRLLALERRHARQELLGLVCGLPLLRLRLRWELLGRHPDDAVRRRGGGVPREVLRHLPLPLASFFPPVCRALNFLGGNAFWRGKKKKKRKGRESKRKTRSLSFSFARLFLFPSFVGLPPSKKSFLSRAPSLLPGFRRCCCCCARAPGGGKEEKDFERK
jgi:hypothetical protein